MFVKALAMIAVCVLAVVLWILIALVGIAYGIHLATKDFPTNGCS